MTMRLRAGAAPGAGLVVIHTATIASADAITRLIAGRYASPHLKAPHLPVLAQKSENCSSPRCPQALARATSPDRARPSRREGAVQR